MNQRRQNPKILDPSSQQVEEFGREEMGRKTEWMEKFLGKTFFHPCKDHLIRRNERNRYCIDCDSSVCQYCVSSGTHRHHKLLKIYRHVYKDVVSLASLDKYIDCSQIQPYKSNKRLVIALNPLPHCGPILTNGVSCEICNRRLAEPEVFKFCSISCKVKALERNIEEDSSGPPMCSLAEKKPDKAKPPGLRRHRRKGIPCRAPFN